MTLADKIKAERSELARVAGEIQRLRGELIKLIERGQRIQGRLDILESLTEADE